MLYAGPAACPACTALYPCIAASKFARVNGHSPAIGSCVLPDPNSPPTTSTCATHLGLQLRSLLQAKLQYSGPGDALRQAWSQGGIRGLYKGYTATYARESLGSAVMFAAYELVKQELTRVQASIPLI